MASYMKTRGTVSNSYFATNRLFGSGDFLMRRLLSNLPRLLDFARDVVRTGLMRGWRTLVLAHAPVYRPEAHYMRGPGPKWRAKHIRPEI